MKILRLRKLIWPSLSHKWGQFMIKNLIYLSRRRSDKIFFTKILLIIDIRNNLNIKFALVYALILNNSFKSIGNVSDTKLCLNRFYLRMFLIIIVVNYKKIFGSSR